MRLLLSVVMVAGFNIYSPPQAQAQRVEVDCLEYQKMSGKKAPCEHFDKLKVDPENLKSVKKKYATKTCIAEAQQKYGKDNCPTGVTLWGDPAEGKTGNAALCSRAVDTCHKQQEESQPQKEKPEQPVLWK